MNDNETSEPSHAVSVIPPTPLEPELAPQPSPAAADPIDLTATNPSEMRHAQHELIVWMQNKIILVRGEVDQAKVEAAELVEAYEVAKRRKWNTITIAKHRDLAAKRVTLAEARVDYYSKILAALLAGYYIVPPMDMELFAIRTDKKKPAKHFKMLSWEMQGNFQQASKPMPIGDGDYKNPHPKVVSESWNEIKGTDGRTVKPFYADAWYSIEFPVNMLKPRIMESTGRAMALKIFDELGVLPQDFKRNPDPVILGRIFEPKKHGNHSQKVITFMVAWHLNTKDL